MGPFRASGERLGGLLGTSWEPLGGLCGPLGGILGASWEPPGVSWRPLGGLLGASWGHLGCSAGVLFGKSKIGDVSLGVRCDLEASGGRPGPSWGRLGPSWGRLGAVLGPSWGHLGAILGPSGGHLGPSGGHFGRSYAILRRESAMSKNLQKPKENEGFWPPGGSQNGSKMAS